MGKSSFLSKAAGKVNVDRSKRSDRRTCLLLPSPLSLTLALLCSTLLCSAVLCPALHAMLCYAMLCYAMLCCGGMRHWICKTASHSKGHRLHTLPRRPDSSFPRVQHDKASTLSIRTCLGNPKSLKPKSFRRGEAILKAELHAFKYKGGPPAKVPSPQGAHFVSWKGDQGGKAFRKTSPPKLSSRPGSQEEKEEKSRSLRKALTTFQTGGASSSSLLSRRRRGSKWGAVPSMKPLELYKADDALTTRSMNSNYLLYLSQRPEDTEIRGVKKVLQALETLAKYRKPSKW